MRKTLRKLVGGIALVGSLAGAGCGEKIDYMGKEAIIGGYHISITNGHLGGHIIVRESNDTTFKGPFLTAWDNNRDGRLDEINLKHLPKGHQIEKYANLDSLESLWKRVVKEGRDLK